jgi:hypothetical protein
MPEMIEKFDLAQKIVHSFVSATIDPPCRAFGGN